MPIDPSRLPALRQELIYAKSVKPGGQEPDPGRVAAVEEQIALHEAAERAAVPAEPETTDASNESTDYESHDSDAAEKKAARKPAKKRGRADDEDEPETTDATVAADEQVESAPVEVADENVDAAFAADEYLEVA